MLLLLVVVGVGVVLQWCADVPVLGCAVVCRRWSPAVAAARQRARGGGGASVAQSSGGEHGSQAPAHTEHTVMVTLGTLLNPPSCQGSSEAQPRSWLPSTE